VKHITVRWLGQRDYFEVWTAMQRFTDSRTPETADEIWLLEHPAVYTVGVRGRSRYHSDGSVEEPRGLPPQADIPLIHTDRGGLITYHGPGQLIAYTLFDLARKDMSVRDLVSALENATIALLKQYGIHGQTRSDAPGVYVDGAKIASLGLRVRKFRSYHGLSLNVDLDLAPFRNIDPCGYKNLPVTRLADLGAPVRVHEVAVPLLGCLMKELSAASITANLRHLPEETVHDQSA